MTNEFDLERFVAAQDHNGTYARAVTELRNGRKRTHWMWFIFPQIAGLGSSPTSKQYAITSLAEAVAYMQHSLLRARLIECTSSIAALDGSAEQIFGTVDARKLQSSMTLFARASSEELFTRALDRFFDGHPDAATMRLLQLDEPT